MGFNFVVHVRTVDLVPLGVILPRDRVGMVAGWVVGRRRYLVEFLGLGAIDL
jgi:hypothetical protein